MNNSKRILAALLAGAMVLCAGCGKEEETEEESSNSTAVEVTDVTSGAMSSEYTLNGKIAPSMRCRCSHCWRVRCRR